MKNKKLNIIKKLISFLLLLVIGGIVFNSTFFLHTHRTACGKLIVHAHPFDKKAEKNKPFSQHEHNKIDLQIISSLDYFENVDYSVVVKYNPILETEFLSKSCLHSNTLFYFSYTNRGPPFIYFSV